jgi:uncharacterized membrane protein YfcA
VLKTILASVLLGVSLFLAFLQRRQVRLPGSLSEAGSTSDRVKLISVGAVVGLLVAVTSIGSGSLLMIFLLLLVPLPFADLVGTDILFGLVTMGLTPLLDGPLFRNAFFAARGRCPSRRRDWQPSDTARSRTVLPLAL